MKKILTVFTGGTICCSSDGSQRKLNPILAKRALLANFAESSSPYSKIAGELFEDSEFPEIKKTLSENMTVEKLDFITEHILSFDQSRYSGIIILHGTDTLAFSAAVLSHVLSNCEIPVMLVSGNRPPTDSLSNANENFRTAVELIMNGYAPGVFVPYRNSDGQMHLHYGEKIMQCPDFSEDFYSIPVIVAPKRTDFEKIRPLPGNVLLLKPYTGLDYSRIDLNGIAAVVHGTYHSGTLCTDTVKAFAMRCEKHGIPLYIAPCRLSPEQYSSAFELASDYNIHFLYTSAESAYGKILAGISFGLSGRMLTEYMNNY